jgi:TPR repeat protein
MRFTSIIPALMASLAALPASSQALTPHEEYQAGLDAARERQYAEALNHFQSASREGHKDAQRISGLMLLYGEHLYRGEVQSDRAQAVQWLRKAADSGCEVSKAMVRHLQP